MTAQPRKVVRPGGRTMAAPLAFLVACMLATGLTAVAQQPGLTPPEDVIFARKILMAAIDGQMAQIEMMTVPGGRLDLAQGQQNADLISSMLGAFPHMFPASTNQWKQGADRDPATDTYASPDVWTNFAAFYKMASDASQLALDASKADSADEFKTTIDKLRATCNACHAAYLKID